MLHEVLKHSTVKTVTIVEIDDVVIDACAKHFRRILGNRNVFEDRRVTLVKMDAKGWIEREGGVWDVVINDTSEPCGPSEVRF